MTASRKDINRLSVKSREPQWIIEDGCGCGLMILDYSATVLGQ